MIQKTKDRQFDTNNYIFALPQLRIVIFRLRMAFILKYDPV